MAWRAAAAGPSLHPASPHHCRGEIVRERRDPAGEAGLVNAGHFAAPRLARAFRFALCRALRRMRRIDFVRAGPCPRAARMTL